MFNEISFDSNQGEEDEIESVDAFIDLSSSFNQAQEDEAYTKVKILGRGAFGEAVLYRKTITNELIVWKEINLLKADEREKGYALNEIEILSQLDHINIVAYYNNFFDGSSLFIEMEYANDGTLHHKIMSQDKSFPESEILIYFYQVVSAVAYIHSIGILHRDIKTLNIFMNKNKLLKLGDFGISKVLEETYGDAKTCVGTPYYMSPELVKGESYNSKSDIWACGCVLYELLTLRKVFDGTNQLKLIMSILEKDYDEISGSYSIEIRNVVQIMLRKDADARPDADEILKNPIFEKAIEFIKTFSKIPPSLTRVSSQRSLNSSSNVPSTPTVATFENDVFFWGGGKQIPQKLECFSDSNFGVDVAAGFSHFAVVTIEKELFTWANIQGGTEILGQLCHGNTAMYRSPKKVEFFDGIPLKKVCCGEDFSIILTESGEVFSCGSDYFGCLGCDNAHGDKVLLPVKVEALSDMVIQDIACGDCHVIALATDGRVYSWGSGELGRLGLGNEDDQAIPQLVPLQAQFSKIVSIECGRDNTLILTSSGQLIAFGSNEFNKMALNQTFRFKKTDKSAVDVIRYSLSPIPVRALKSYKLLSVSAAKTHSAAIDEFGRLLTFGSNKYGQLGVGDYKIRLNPVLVRGNLSGKEVSQISCGNGFTVAATKDNHLYSWGRTENGRLGIELKEKKNFCLPKAIFGSLHRVKSLSSRHWNTIIITEQFLSSKTMITKSLSIKEETDTNVTGDTFDKSSTFSFNNTSKFDSKSFDNSDENLPPWLANELKESDNIPIDDTGDNVPEWLVNQWDNDEIIPIKNDSNPVENDVEDISNLSILNDTAPSLRNSYQMLKENKNLSICKECPDHVNIKLKELEIENARLNKIVKEQQLLIAKLQRERDSYKKCATKLFELGNKVVQSQD